MTTKIEQLLDKIIDENSFYIVDEEDDSVVDGPFASEEYAIEYFNNLSIDEKKKKCSSGKKLSAGRCMQKLPGYKIVDGRYVKLSLYKRAKKKVISGMNKTTGVINRINTAFGL
jgi:hypothetical protein